MNKKIVKTLPSRRLALSRETIRTLATRELHNVPGGISGLICSFERDSCPCKTNVAGGTCNNCVNGG